MRHPFIQRVTSTALSVFLCLSTLASSAHAVVSIPNVTENIPAVVDENTLVRAHLTDTANAQSATIMVYMIGSDLESKSGLATADLQEMMAAQFGDNVHIIVQTMGCKKWKNEQIRSDTSERFSIANGTLTLLDDSLGQLDSTDPSTLTDFIQYCTANYPADRNMLILWDHGAGPVYGFGYDEFQSADASLTLDEIQSAIKNAGTTFDMIGMDACLMSCVETCYALKDYADYLVASEDFEPANGWGYQQWITALGENVSISTEELGSLITQGFLDESTRAGEDGILAMIDLTYAAAIYSAWRAFAYANDSTLTSTNYSWKAIPTSRALSTNSRYSMDDYCVTDMLAVVSMIDEESESTLSELLSSAVISCEATEGNKSMTGLCVTLPYDNSTFYQSCMDVFLKCGFEETYLEWLGTFADNVKVDNYYANWQEWVDTWKSWEYFKSQTETTSSDSDAEQQDNILTSSAQSGTWKKSADSTFYYCVMPSGDITYQDSVSHNCYYYVKQTETWWQWKLRSWCWEACKSPNYPTDLS